MSEIKLGQKATDTITGLKGIVVSRCEFISGLVEYGLRPRAKDGTRPEICWIEENALVVDDEAVV